MKKNVKWKLLVFLAACIGLLAFAVPASAAALTAGSEGVTKSNLNLRSSASTSSSVIVTIPRGRSVMVTAVNSAKTWYKVKYNGKTGYVVASYVQDIKSQPSGTGYTTRVMAANIRLRSSASSSAGYYKVNGTKYYIPRGRRVVLDTTYSNSSWWRVSSYGYTGYIQKGYFTTDVKSASVVKKVNYRTKPSTSSAKVISGMLPVGTKVTVFKTSNGWHYCGVTISGNFKMGYIKSGYLNISATSTGTTKTTTATVNLRKGAGTSYSVIFAVPSGKKVTLLATLSNGWSRVKYNGTTGYIKSSYLK